MNSAGAILVLFLTAVLCGVPTKAQIPAVCANNASFSRRECCPIVDSGGPCGSDLSPPRGECVDLPGVANDTTDVRYNWPHFYTRVCSCNGNYGDFDCGGCKFDYSGDDCNVKSTPRERRSVADFTDEQWRDYINVLKEAKSSQSRYVAITRETLPGEDAINTTVPLTVYDYAVWVHHYSAKDNNDRLTDIDWAHERTGFPTWHRLYLLQIERQIHYMMGNETFAFAYWDWRNPDDREVPFATDRLGVSDANGIVSGDLYDDGYMTVCWGVDSSNPCDPMDSAGIRQLVRCSEVNGENPCKADGPNWPTYDEYNEALEQSSYDVPDYNKFVNGSFRNQVEGFVVVDNCNGDQMCSPVPDYNISGLRRTLHNKAHILLGIGSLDSEAQSVVPGAMADVAASPNDHIFMSHHTMIDCILEKWLIRYPDEEYPNSTEIRKGHGPDDYIVPFFPLYTHNDMFKEASNFGYKCDLPDGPTVGPTDGPTVGPTDGPTGGPTDDPSTTDAGGTSNKSFLLLVAALASLTALGI